MVLFENGRKTGGWQPTISSFFSPVRSSNSSDARMNAGVGGTSTSSKEDSPSTSRQQPVPSTCAGCPHLVLKRLSEHAHLKKCKDSPTMNGPSDEYEVEEVLDIQRFRGNTRFLIKWKGWSPEYNSWEAEDSVRNCMSLVVKYCLEKSTQNSYRRDLVRWALGLVCDSERPDLMVLSQLVGHKVPVNGYVSRTEVSGIRKEGLKLLELPDKRLYRKLAESFGSWQEFVRKVEARKEQAEVIRKWEADINRASGERCPLYVENHVDLVEPPDNFVYIKDFKPGPGIQFPEDPMVGCSCDDCFDGRKGCCPAQANATLVYNKHGTLVANRGSAIIECNQRCKCGQDCPNRVVQKGRQVPLTIFRTPNERGWGVRTERRIKKGTFLFEYLGEVITDEEAERRGQIYDEQGITYLFDLDYDTKGEAIYAVDAGFYGNVSHFVNHSCESNMTVYSVWINNLDHRMPRLAFFANRDICCQEELTFDYKMSLGESEDPADSGAKKTRSSMSGLSAQKLANKVRIPCLCGAPSCHKFLF